MAQCGFSKLTSDRNLLKFDCHLGSIDHSRAYWCSHCGFLKLTKTTAQIKFFSFNDTKDLADIHRGSLMLSSTYWCHNRALNKLISHIKTHDMSEVDS